MPIFEDELRRIIRATIVLLSHLLMATIVIAAVWVLEVLFRAVWRDNDPRLFGAVPLNYIFQATDVAVLLMFVLNGIVETLRFYRRGPLRRTPLSERPPREGM